MKSWHLILLSALAGNMPAIADEVYNYNDSGEDEFGGFYGDEDVIHIATGTSKPISHAPAVATVINAKDIQMMGATHLDEVLEKVPGLHVSMSSISRFDTIYSMRGIRTGFNPQILVLVNGTEFKNLSTGGLPFTFRLPINTIERIEVIRGPGSAVFGADAFSGVINIVTKNEVAEDTQVGTVGARFGSFSSRDFWFETGFKQEEWSGYLAGEKSRSDGDESRVIPVDSQSGLDAIFQTNASLTPGALSTNYDVTNIFGSLTFGQFNLENWYWKQNHGGVGPGAGQALDPDGFQDAEHNRIKLSWQDSITDELEIQADASWVHAKQETMFNIFPSGAVLPIGDDGNIGGNDIKPILFTDGFIGNPSYSQDVYRVNTAMNWHGIEGHSFRVATGWFEQSIDTSEKKNFGPGILEGDGRPDVVDGTLTDVTGTDYIYLQDLKRTVKYLSVQDEWQLSNDWELTLGIRYDDYSDFGSTYNPRAALVWETNHNLTTKFLYGSAFRAPSFSEQFLKNNPVNLGNSELSPETIDTWEVAFDYRPAFGINMTLSLFRYDAEGMIEIVPDVDNPAVSRYQNSIDQRGKGFEFTYQHELTESLNLSGSYSYQKSENLKIDEDVHDVPGKQLFVDLRYELDANWSGSVQTFWIADRKRAKIASEVRTTEVGDYSNVNLNILYRPDSGNWQSKLLIRNLFDSGQYEPSNGGIPGDFPLEGRRVSVEFSYTY